MRSPRCQLSYWEARMRSTRDSTERTLLAIVNLLQSELNRHTVQGPRELLAKGVRSGAKRAGQLGPFAPEAALVGQVALVVGQQTADLVEQIPAGNDPLGRRRAARDAIKNGVAGLGAALVALVGLLAAGLVQYLVAGHCQQ